MTSEPSLLRILLKNQTHFISRVTLLHQLQLSSEALHSIFQTLTSWGYLLEFHPTLGIRLLELPPTFHLDELRARLPLDFTWPLYHLHETHSTMDFLKREGDQGAPHGTLAIANSQSAGRGRLGRTWNSRHELGLYLSILVRPDFGIECYSRLTILTAVATLQAVEKLTARPFELKWPNDLMIDQRKLAGILTEVHHDSQHRPFAVIGLGLNLLHQTDDFPTELQPKVSSLLMATNRVIRRTDFLAEWIPTFQRALLAPFDQISEIWKSKCLNLGTSIQVTTPQGKIYGTAIDIESNGALILRADHGIMHTILSGIVERP